eukprot:3200224-Pyramimonas_sp.AAC.1
MGHLLTDLDSPHRNAAQVNAVFVRELPPVQLQPDDALMNAARVDAVFRVLPPVQLQPDDTLQVVIVPLHGLIANDNAAALMDGLEELAPAEGGGKRHQALSKPLYHRRIRCSPQLFADCSDRCNIGGLGGGLEGVWR